jgi:Holliday junction DNA helicase RuvA
MIGQLRGQLLHKKPNLLLVDVHGIGYEVHIPVTSYYDLPQDGGEIVLQIHTHVREDALSLFGFATQRDKEFFLKLLSISGIGPKLAIAIMSGARVEELALAVAHGDVTKLTAIPGVGRKTAERMVLELKNQISGFLLPEQRNSEAPGEPLDAVQQDVISALVNLGYPRPGAEKALSQVLRAADCDRSSFEDVLRSTLRRLSG